MKTSENIRLILTVVICGAGTLALEILASRYMVPSFGTSIFIWGAVLSVTLFYLVVGYRWGGKVASRVQHPLKRLAIHILLASAWIALTPVIGPYILSLGLLLGSKAGPIFVALVLLGPSLVLLSTTVPLAIGIIDSHYKGEMRASLVAGNLFAISTVGSIFGALVAAYCLLPWFGVNRSLLIVSLGLLPLAIQGFASLRVQQTAVALVFGLAITRILIPPPELKMGLEFLDRRATPYGQVDVVADHRDNSRILLLDGASQNHIGGDQWDESRFEYIDIITLKAKRLRRPAIAQNDTLLGFKLGGKETTASERPQTALVLGLGAGVLAKKLQGVGYRVECVEIDHNVLEIAESYFAFEQSATSEVHITEARRFLADALREGKMKWDLIVVDLAGGGVHPEHVYTREAYHTMQQLLRADGLLVVNFVSYLSPPHNQVVMHSAATLAGLFPEVLVYSVYPDAVARGEMGQALVFAAPEPVQDTLFGDAEAHRHLVSFDPSLRPLTDDWNPMANWSVQANAEWHGNIVDWLGAAVLIPH